MERIGIDDNDLTGEFNKTTETLAPQSFMSFAYFKSSARNGAEACLHARA